MAQVFVVDRASFFDGAWPHGFVALGGADAARFLEQAAERGRFVDRDEAERREDWKQWIPYCVLRWRPGTRTDGEPAAVYVVRRTAGGGEQRLRGAWSIGLGGHVDAGDELGAATGPALFAASLARELAEELVLGEHLPAPRFAGLLNDDETAVGRVHAGLVYVWDLPGASPPAIPVREISKLTGGFRSLVELRDLWQDRARFETWSQFLLHAGIAGPMGASPVVVERPI